MDKLSSVGVIGVAGAIALSFWPVPTSFTVSAITDGIRVATAAKGPKTSWFVGKARVLKSQDAGPTDFDGTVVVREGTDVLIERIGRGPLRIQCRPMNVVSEGHGDDIPVAELYGRDDDGFLGTVKGQLAIRIDDLEARAASGDSLVLPINGSVQLGGDTRPDVRHVAPLREGKVVLVGSTLFGDSHYSAGGSDLLFGDSVAIDTTQPMMGLVMVDGEPSMKAVFRAVGMDAHISRYGSRGYKVGTSLVSRVTSDESIQAIWAAALTIFGALKALPTLKQARSRKKN
jgi:hypothetical protein